MVDAAPSQRIIPGAPPPPPVSKSQKKKRKTTKSKESDEPSHAVEIPDSTAAALTETAPTLADIQNENVASELVAPLETINENAAENLKKSSSTVEFMNKRIKMQTKKASRIASYASKDLSELNEDQKKSVASLPLIQGGIKELEETKKAIESIEAEEVKDLEKQRAEEEKSTQERITQAISNTKELYLQRSSTILSLIRLSAHLSSSEPGTFHLNVNDTERHAIQIIVETLTSVEGTSKDHLLSRLLDGEASFEDISYERILSIVESFRNPPIEEEITFADGPEPPAEETQVEAEQDVAEQVVEPSVEPVVPMTGSFHFMQESELEETAFETGAEWVEKPEEHETIVTNGVIESEGVSTEVVETPTLVTVNGGDTEPPAYSTKLDWAADDNEEILDEELEVHANGEADIPSGITGEADIPSGVNGVTEIDEDGFVRAKSGRGRIPENRPEHRGRGRGGFRGDRGEHRGGFRGRGDGEFRGRGGFRGGDRGRGDFRGRGRGGGDFRGRGRGGGERGSGFRGGRGGYNENRSVVQSIPS